MKKSFVALAATLLAVALAAVSCSSDSDAKPSVLAPATGEGAKTLNIRFIDGDSVTARYALAMEYQKQALSTLSQIDKTGQAKQAEIQKFAAQIEQKTRNNGYLTQESYEGDMNKLNKMQQEAAALIDRMQRQASNEMAAHQQEMNDSIESFIQAYNVSKGYDAILFRAAGVYFNPALDITDEVVAGLNARYEAGLRNK